MALVGTRRITFHARGIARRNRLLDSARVLLAERELDAINLGDVARHAKVPKGSAYYFYADIADLYANLLIVLQDELIMALKRPIRRQVRRWQDVITILTRRGVRFYTRNAAARQLQIGPKTPPELKLRDRQRDVAIGKLYEQHLQCFFALPWIADRSRVFFRAVEIADLMFGLSMLESGTITSSMSAEAARAGIAYLESYLPAKLARRKRTARAAAPAPVPASPPAERDAASRAARRSHLAVGAARSADAVALRRRAD